MSLQAARRFTNIIILRKRIYEVIEGELGLTIEGEPHTVRPGVVAIVPSGARHSVKALGDGWAIIVDSPRRPEFE
jgi:quercetin dioxygenase-like cupin family protein